MVDRFKNVLRTAHLLAKKRGEAWLLTRPDNPDFEKIWFSV